MGDLRAAASRLLEMRENERRMNLGQGGCAYTEQSFLAAWQALADGVHYFDELSKQAGAVTLSVCRWCGSTVTARTDSGRFGIVKDGSNDYCHCEFDPVTYIPAHPYAAATQEGSKDADR